MKHVFGLNEYLYRQKKTKQHVVINTQEIINGHLLLTGMYGTGTGKSYHIISKEGRKFGLGLWCASQSPTHFSEVF